MKMRCHDVLLAEREGEVSHIVGTPFVQSSLPFDAFHILMRSRHDDTDYLYLIIAYFACQPGIFQTVLDGSQTVFYSIVIVDEFSVKVCTCGGGVLRNDETLDVGSHSAVGTVRLFHVQYYKSHIWFSFLF